MKKITLRIENPFESKTVALEDEITIGRTGESQIVLSDSGLSRKNTTFFRDGDSVFVVDENSTNGTFVGGERISRAPVQVFDGDVVKLGSETRISIEIREPAAISSQPSAATPQSISKTRDQNPKTKKKNPKIQTQKPKSNALLMMAIVSSILILALGGVALLIANRYACAGCDNPVKPTPPQALQGALIPVRVVDPLGGEDPDDIDDLIASWEVEEKTINADDLAVIKSVSTTETNKPSDLNVSIEFFKQQLNKALNHGASGAEPAGLIPLPTELVGGNVSKQKAKLAELIKFKSFLQPMDFGDLARLRLEGKFVGEMPMATDSYVLDIGGSATGEEFTSFEFDQSGRGVSAPITPGTPKYQYLKQLADNFDGQKYDLNNPNDRKQMRIRLLRMYNKNSRPLFEEFTKEYYQKFNVPLRVTSLLRSMDYQIGLNKTNANSFKVSGKGSLPPHTSGCAFDVSRKNLTRDEQNWMMQKLAELERNRKLDSLREGAANACFHSFIYPDGIEPTNLNVTIAEIISSDNLAANFLIPELSPDSEF